MCIARFTLVSHVKVASLNGFPWRFSGYSFDSRSFDENDNISRMCFNEFGRHVANISMKGSNAKS